MQPRTALVPASKRLQIVSGRFNRPLAEAVADCVGVELLEPNLGAFANGEIHCRFDESIRGNDLFIVQTHADGPEGSLNDALMETLIMVDAAKRASAKRITVVAPFFPYARQDRKSNGREPITAKLVSDLLAAAGAKRLVSMDMHSGQIQGFFDGPVDHLTAMPVLENYFRDVQGELVVVSPDTGRVKVAARYANALHAGLAFVYKQRRKEEKNSVEAMALVGEVEGATCVLIDDMIDTGGTMVAAAEQLKAHGAAHVYAAATHGVFSGPAIQRFRDSPIEKVVVTDTLPLGPDRQLDKIERLSVAPIIADAIRAVFEDSSVSEIFDGKNQS